LEGTTSSKRRKTQGETAQNTTLLQEYWERERENMGRKEFNPTIDGGKLGRPNGEEKQQLMPTLSTTDNWILLTHLLKESNKILLPFREAKLVARSEVQNSRHKGWWREGKDELATHLMSTEVWISTKGRITEDTRTTIQEDIEADDSKDTPSFGTEDLEAIHSQGTEAGLLGI